jgi:AraC family transcriptional regulator
MMQVEIKLFPETWLMGTKRELSLSNNETQALWKSFMQQRHQIEHFSDRPLFSVECYDGLDFFEQFNPNTPFEKWAAVQKEEQDPLPKGMETLLIPAGLYAVFLYKGKASEAFRSYQYIHTEWLPASAYQLDDRPHFARMDERYKNDAPDSEEELWVPIMAK